jgi:gentisate 1,2-dioxygenase
MAVTRTPVDRDQQGAPTARDWTGDARFVEYSRAADPIATGALSPIPIRTFPPDIYEGHATRIVPLDLSSVLGGSAEPATSPGLLAHFVSIREADQLSTAPNASSEFYFVLRGRGSSSVDGDALEWSAGDFFTLPAGCRSDHRADVESVLFWVTDEPLLRYLGVRAEERRFAPTRYDAAEAMVALRAVADSPDADERNRISVVLVNQARAETLTVTHTLWAMFGLLPSGAVQAPHRHQSVALDLIVSCADGCYTLVGDRIDAQGQIVDPQRVDWVAGGAFVTPPGAWHAHHNESGQPAYLVPVQDAGLHTFLRSLDIRFVTPGRDGVAGS